MEWYERYGLKDLSGDINGQLEQAEAFMKADKDGFPIPCILHGNGRTNMNPIYERWL